ncbi:MAG: hypothetical protein UW69_C0017G0018 [Microgenomates group bacterium GW2011_GWA2_44_7]|nr:MAG: hypothetical protein UW69_C0017G0018 [Microgenomates group bacterium GW2011_GWA2_44_7]KKT78609.1 MAG: hypothetical protein UW73_C0001G0056 [Microgenomates group bacterium GW2011_GWB1_44_8]
MKLPPLSSKRIGKILIVLALIVIAIFSYNYFAPFGKVVSYNFPFKLPGTVGVTNFPPGSTGSLKIPSQVLKTETARFSLAVPPRTVDSLKATLKFKPITGEVLLGVRGRETDKFVYVPLYNSILQNLGWNKTEQEGITLWQKTEDFRTLSDFVGKVRLDKKIVSYYVPSSRLQTLKNIQVESQDTAVVDRRLRGNLQMQIMVDKKPLVIKLFKQDLNYYPGEDKYKLVLTSDGKTIHENDIGDDGITDNSLLKLTPQEKEIAINEVIPGIYTLNINYLGTGQDSEIVKIEVNQKKVVFTNDVFVSDIKPVSVWTSSPRVVLSTPHGTALQTITVNGAPAITLDKVGKGFVFEVSSLPLKIATGSAYSLEAPKGDISFTTKEYLAFSEKALFNPDPFSNIPLTADNLKSTDYILSSYKPAGRDGQWMKAEISINPQLINIENNGRVYFSLEIPDLAKNGGELEIDSLEVQVKSLGLLEPKEENSRVQTTASSKGLVAWVSQPVQAIRGFFSSIGNKFSRKPAPRSSSTPSPQNKRNPTPTNIPSPSPVASVAASPFVPSSNVEVRVLNAGAPVGTASKFAEVLKISGFPKTVAANLDSDSYKNVTVRYKSASRVDVDRIIKLLGDEYGPATRDENATGGAQITVILGSK